LPGDRDRDRFGDLVLYREDVGEVAISEVVAS
jgi:hypothetical protein